MLDSKLFSTDYIYENIFNLSEDHYMQERDLAREDHKRLFRLAQIEGEGNDPVKSGRSYGTPHDLASMYGRRSVSTEKGGQPGNVPQGYEDPGYGMPGEEGGRPLVHKSHYGTQDGLGGADPLGTHAMKGGYPSDDLQENVKTKSVYFKNKDMLKDLVFNNTVEDDTELLNEENIKDLDKQ